MLKQFRPRSPFARSLRAVAGGARQSRDKLTPNPAVFNGPPAVENRMAEPREALRLARF